MEEAVVLLYVVSTFAIINPLRAKNGLFWIPACEGDQDNYEAWVEATQRAQDQVTSGEHQRFQELLSCYNPVTKSLRLVQFPSRWNESFGGGKEGKGESRKKEKEMGDDEEVGKLRNVYAAILTGQKPGFPSLEEGEEQPGGQQ
eukprot:CAMPEP_0201535812 /NCGR_PEP_ID=MMETSP0161_2-20130828/60071_1 /ASSEMBLY_ACC=CAM_ASM_000251 /TAXON_ID=180227 /ORGANISM="Neoparamoeba aestuarina, Strain SoJaBio B1-5/56/2" /LENGTH=143 /DNA_ID=CAMNT_0047941175 /DNA_START=39 /DNA_END=467 /DNA_ORIENTATION=-